MDKTKGQQMKMSKYAVYQLPFDHKNKRDMGFFEASQIEAISDEYELVAQVDARSLDEVFRIGNFICESDRTLIEIVGEMHSISVGDIIANLESGEEYVVASVGFDKISMKEAA